MKNSEKAEKIGRLVKEYLNMCLYDYVQAEAKVESTKAGKKLWDEHNPYDGVGCMGSCPYNIERECEYLRGYQTRWVEAQEIYNYFVETFLKKLDEENE